MDVDVKGAAIGVASAVYASVGFLLSVFAVVLNPLIPTSDNPQGHHHPSLILHGTHHRTSRSDRDTDLSTAVPPASQTNSVISASSQASSSAPSLHSQSLRSFGEEDNGAPTSPPLPVRRSSTTRKLASVPAATDYFSPNPAEIAAAGRDSLAETPSFPAAPVRSAPAPVVVASPTTAITPQPVLPRRPTPTSIPPLTKSHTCNLEEPPSSHTHSFRILHFKRSWTGRRDKPTRSATCPEPASLLHPDPNANAIPNSKHPAAISRPPSTSSIKHFCPVKKIEEKTLRKSLSSPESGLSKWKSHRRKCTNVITNTSTKSSTNPTPDISQPQHHLRLSKSPQSQSPSPPRSRSQAQTQPRARTQPYEAPYFFPSPASPDAGDYIRRAKSGRPSSSYASYPYNNNGNSTPPSSFRQLPLADIKVNDNVEYEKASSSSLGLGRKVYVERGVVSAPPTKLKFSG